MGNTMRKKTTGKFIIGVAAIAAAAAAIWLAPVASQAGGTVAVADEQTTATAPAANLCESATWPNIPAECLKNGNDDQVQRVISFDAERG